MLTFRFGLATAAVIFLAGCGSGQPVYSVNGIVTFNGKPMVGGGSIAFIPTGTQAGIPPGGDIKSDGTYELMTYSPGDGSVVGDYRVVISQTIHQEPKKVEDGAGASPPPIETVPAADQIPALYSDPQKSPLTAKVEAKPNQIDFALQPQ